MVVKDPNVKKDIPGEFISMYMPNPLKATLLVVLGENTPLFVNQYTTCFSPYCLHPLTSMHELFMLTCWSRYEQLHVIHLNKYSHDNVPSPSVSPEHDL